MSKPRKPLIIDGADGKPIEIAPGDWFQNPKAHPERMMLNSLSAKARQVYACLELGSVAYRRELAVTPNGKGKLRPLTPSDIAERTGLDPSDVAHGFEELERAGLAERRDDDGKGLRRGHVRIYCFATPPTAEDGAENGGFPGARARKRSPDFRPPWVDSRPKDDPLRRFVNREKVVFSADFVVARANIEAAEVAARAIQEAENVARAALECCGARFPLIRKKQIETKGGDSGVSVICKNQKSSSSSKTTTTTAGQEIKPTTPEPMPEAIWEEARRLTQSRSFPKTAVEDYWNLCQKLAGDRGPLDAEAVTRIMQRTATAAGGSVNTFGYFPKSAADQVQAYLDHGAEEHVMAAGAGASEWDRLWAEVEAEES